jgi:superoxide reductase
VEIFICNRCGYAAFKEAPRICPICGAPQEQFKAQPDAIKKIVDPSNLTELEKKHTPVISINKQCGLVESGCIDVNVKIGQILHPMEDKHYITYIDIYVDHNFVARYHLSPEKLNPVLGLHLKISQGRLIVLENCNLHGRWISQATL